MNSFEIGLSALRASQRGIDLAGQNLANATTPGYHRQSLLTSARVVAGEGLGVEVTQVRRLYEASVENALRTNVSRSGRVDAELTTLRKVESLWTPGTGTVGDRTEQLFNGLAQLTARPDDVALRQTFLSTASGLAGEVNNLARSFTQTRNDLRGEIDDSVAKLNAGATRLASLNQQIESIERVGGQANDLRDQRDEVIKDIASRVDVRTIDQPYGVVNVIAANAALVVGNTAAQFQVNADSAGVLSLSAQGTTAPLTVSEGSLAGQLNAYNQIVTQQTPALDNFARELASRIDSAHATGLGLDGPVTTALGSRAVSSPTAPLATTAPLPVQAGSLYLSVTDQSTGHRTLTQIAIDPATQSLQDVAAAITTASGGQVTGTVTSDNRLQLQAQSGFAFDFAGRIPSDPTNVMMNGTTVPTISGNYTGSANGTYSVQVVGSGTVGVTANLRLEARDANNNLVASVNIGQGYVPGTPLSIGNGMTVRLGAGTTSSGSFSIPVVAQADTSGVLAATGVGSLFQGQDALSLKVRPEVMSDPRQLAGSRDGEPGDGSNFARMEQVRDQPVLAGQTFQEYLAGQSASAGAAVQQREDQLQALQALGDRLQAEQQSVSGVDVNEEALSLLQHQREFEMAARFITVVNSTLDELVNIVR
jgi:flagellar hook-associated protein FlgK